MGTSGSSSDVVRSHQYAVDTLNHSRRTARTTFDAPAVSTTRAEAQGKMINIDKRSLSINEGIIATTGLAHRWMRVGGPAESVDRGINRQLTSNGRTRISKGPLHRTQTHTLDEIHTAVESTRFKRVLKAKL